MVPSSPSADGFRAPADFAVPLPSGEPATRTLAELRAGVLQRYERLEALEVEYRTDQYRTDPDPSGAAQWSAVEGLLPAAEVQFAMRGDRRYRKDIPLEDGRPSMLGTSIYAFDGRESRSLTAGGRVGRVHVAGDKPSILDLDGYAWALAIPLSDEERAGSAATRYFLPGALEVTANRWRVQPTLEWVDGAACHVLHSGDGQRLWLDPAIGFAVRFRETHQAVRNVPADRWPLDFRTASGDFQQAADDVWLPRRVDTVTYARASAPESRWNRARTSTRRRVSRLAVNDGVADGRFSLAFPVGANVQDDARGKYYLVGEGHQEFEITLREA